MPPRRIILRLRQELSKRFHLVTFARARGGHGHLAAGRVFGSGAGEAMSETRRTVESLGTWEHAIRLTAANADLRARLEKRRHIAMSGRAELFGAEPQDVGKPPQWHLDLLTGTNWPQNSFASVISYAELDRSSDVKLAWELSRLRNLVALAQSAAVLDDRNALIQLEAELDDWLVANPVGYGVNWACAMEVALRAVNLICVDGILSAAGLASEQLRDRLVRSLYQHGWYLYRNLEISTLNGNHFLADGVGMIWLGRYFGRVGEADHWLRQGRKMVLEAAREQVLGDGLDHEGSLPYHLLVTEMFAVARSADPDALSDVDQPLARMLDAACAFCDRRGRVPNIGDDDGGRVLALSNAPARDARRVLALAACLIDHQAARDLAGDHHTEDALWLAGMTPAPAGTTVLRPGPMHFSEGGVLVLGDGNDHIVIDVGPIGFRGRGGHGHIDAMSFEAMIDGEIVIRDSGTATYTSDPPLRNTLRSPQAHNVVLVDGLSYAELGETLWTMRAHSTPAVMEVGAEGDQQIAVIEHELPAEGGKALHRRTLEWRKGFLRWTDRVAAPRGARIVHLLQLPERAEMSRSGISCGRFDYHLEAPNEAQLELSVVPWSEAYGALQSGMRAQVSYLAGDADSQLSWNVVDGGRGAG